MTITKYRAGSRTNLRFSDTMVDLLNRKLFVRNDETLASDDYNVKVAAYADQRVSPNGVDSLIARLMDAKERYRDLPGSSMNNPRTDMLIECAVKIERQIMSKCSLSPSQISDIESRPKSTRLRRRQCDMQLSDQRRLYAIYIAAYIAITASIYFAQAVVPGGSEVSRLLGRRSLRSDYLSEHCFD